MPARDLCGRTLGEFVLCEDRDGAGPRRHARAVAGDARADAARPVRSVLRVRRAGSAGGARSRDRPSRAEAIERDGARERRPAVSQAARLRARADHPERNRNELPGRRHHECQSSPTHRCRRSAVPYRPTSTGSCNARSPGVRRVAMVPRWSWHRSCARGTRVGIGAGGQQHARDLECRVPEQSEPRVARVQQRHPAVRSPARAGERGLAIVGARHCGSQRLSAAAGRVLPSANLPVQLLSRSPPPAGRWAVARHRPGRYRHVACRRRGRSDSRSHARSFTRASCGVATGGPRETHPRSPRSP